VSSLPKDEILTTLQTLVSPEEVSLLEKGNVILMINGSEASICSKTIVEDSDDVVVIPVAHGGSGQAVKGQLL